MFFVLQKQLITSPRKCLNPENNSYLIVNIWEVVFLLVFKDSIFLFLKKRQFLTRNFIPTSEHIPPKSIHILPAGSYMTLILESKKIYTC